MYIYILLLINVNCVIYMFHQKLLDRFDYDDEPEDLTPKELGAQSQ